MRLADFMLARLAEAAAEASADIVWATTSTHPDASSELTLARKTLADIRAKRDVVCRLVEAIAEAERLKTTEAAAFMRGLEIAVGMLATPYAAHVDFNPDWRTRNAQGSQVRDAALIEIAEPG